MSDLEKRGAKRISYRSEVVCSTTGNSPLDPRISDLSSTGAFIDSMNGLPAGSRLYLKFPLPSGDVVSVEAEVVHSMEHFGMGVRFLDLDEATRRAIEAFVDGAS
jgi:c-di-GMP-binding flagellar brake protein YcgR